MVHQLPIAVGVGHNHKRGFGNPTQFLQEGLLIWHGQYFVEIPGEVECVSSNRDVVQRAVQVVHLRHAVEMHQRLGTVQRELILADQRDLAAELGENQAAGANDAVALHRDLGHAPDVRAHDQLSEEVIQHAPAIYVAEAFRRIEKMNWRRAVGLLR
ncbi:MAG: hypothetical protein D6791_13990 [Chloroflexi bacterium]|nr:MAG: hypothetical protein D6791_13990 [Chloroflexota bacterium]